MVMSSTIEICNLQIRNTNVNKNRNTGAKTPLSGTEFKFGPKSVRKKKKQLNTSGKHCFGRGIIWQREE